VNARETYRRALKGKVEEARFFFGKLQAELGPQVHVEGGRRPCQGIIVQTAVAPSSPDHRYYLSAFLSASRCVPDYIRKVDKKWLDQWQRRLAKADQTLIDTMRERRNEVAHDLGVALAKTTETIHGVVPAAVADLIQSGRGVPRFRRGHDDLVWVSRSTSQWSFDDARGFTQIVAASERYLELMEGLFTSFEAEHNST
jgi:hypothetical protein